MTLKQQTAQKWLNPVSAATRLSWNEIQVQGHSKTPISCNLSPDLFHFVASE